MLVFGESTPECFRTLRTRMIADRNLGSSLSEKANGGGANAITPAGYERLKATLPRLDR